MTAVLKRELLALFQTVTGWLYIAATIALFGLWFYAVNLSYGNPKLSNTLGSISFLVFITVPVLTMRSLSEERRSKTDQLLLTSPISVGKIVLAKYLAVAAVHTAAVAVMCLAPLIMVANGGSSAAENYVALLGFWLYGLCCLAIGVFVSSLSESQVIAAVLTFVFLFAGYMMANITSLIGDSGVVATALKKVLASYDLYTPMQTFFDGCISLTGIIYYLTVSALFVFLTAQVIQKRRWTVSSKRISVSAFSAGFIALAVALTVFVNLFAGELPSTISQIDVTSAGIYSMTDTTKDFLSKLQKDVTVYVIGTEDNVDTTVKQTLNKYQDSSSHIKVEYIDPYANPTFYQQYTTDNISLGSLIVVCGEISKVIDYNSLFQTEIDYNTYSSNVTGYDGEGQLTSAIDAVTSDAQPVVYELEGHNETALAGNFTTVAEKANATLSQLSLLTSEAVPDDARLVIVNGPKSDLSADDAQKLIDYIGRGGNLLVNLSYEASGELANLDKVLAEYGVSEVPGMVFENDQTMYYQYQAYLLPEIGSSVYTSSVTNMRVFAPYSKAVSYSDTVEGVDFTALLTTSTMSVAKADYANASTSEFEEGDVQGPFQVGLAAVKTSGAATAEASAEPASSAEPSADDAADDAAGDSAASVTSTLVVYGSELMFTDEADQMVSSANSSMFSDTISALTAGGASGNLVIPVKEYGVSQVTIPALNALLCGLAIMAVVPLGCLAAGVAIWYRRRKS